MRSAEPRVTGRGGRGGVVGGGREGSNDGEGVGGGEEETAVRVYVSPPPSRPARFAGPWQGGPLPVTPWQASGGGAGARSTEPPRRKEAVAGRKEGRVARVRASFPGCFPLCRQGQAPPVRTPGGRGRGLGVGGPLCGWRPRPGRRTHQTQRSRKPSWMGRTFYFNGAEGGGGAGRN